MKKAPAALLLALMLMSNGCAALKKGMDLDQHLFGYNVRLTVAPENAPDPETETETE